MTAGKCYWCDGETETRFEEYCSDACRDADAARYDAERREERAKIGNSTNLLCAVCKRPTEETKYWSVKYCSEECRVEFNEKNKKERHCFWCGTVFRGHHAAQYCTDNCKIQAWRAGKRLPRNGYADVVEVRPPLLRLRFSILERDGFRCRYCGRNGESVILQVDHVHPKSKGGLWAEDNLVTACWECNIGKGDRLLREHGHSTRGLGG